MEDLVKKNPGTQLLIVDIDRWGSPVAKQYSINSIPAAWLYDGTEQVSTDLRDVMGQLSQ